MLPDPYCPDIYFDRVKITRERLKEIAEQQKQIIKRVKANVDLLEDCWEEFVEFIGSLPHLQYLNLSSVGFVPENFLKIIAARLRLENLQPNFHLTLDRGRLHDGVPKYIDGGNEVCDALLSIHSIHTLATTLHDRAYFPVERFFANAKFKNIFLWTCSNNISYNSFMDLANGLRDNKSIQKLVLRIDLEAVPLIIDALKENCTLKALTLYTPSNKKANTPLNAEQMESMQASFEQNKILESLCLDEIKLPALDIALSRALPSSALKKLTMKECDWHNDETFTMFCEGFAKNTSLTCLNVSLRGFQKANKLVEATAGSMACLQKLYIKVQNRVISDPHSFDNNFLAELLKKNETLKKLQLSFWKCSGEQLLASLPRNLEFFSFGNEYSQTAQLDTREKVASYIDAIQNNAPPSLKRLPIALKGADAHYEFVKNSYSLLPSMPLTMVCTKKQELDVVVNLITSNQVNIPKLTLTVEVRVDEKYILQVFQALGNNQSLCEVTVELKNCLDDTFLEKLTTLVADNYTLQLLHVQHPKNNNKYSIQDSALAALLPNNVYYFPSVINRNKYLKEAKRFKTVKVVPPGNPL